MDRFPHTITIYKPKNERNPFKEAEFEKTYTGKCKCFRPKQSSERSGVVPYNYFQAVMRPGASVDVSEGYKIEVNYGPTTVIGFVKDVSIHSLAIEIFFQQAKDEIIDSDREEDEEEQP